MLGGAALSTYSACAQRLRTALRSSLRYLQYGGEIHNDLSGCIPGVTRWRLTNLPKHLSPDQVQRVFDVCDRNTATGKRDYAILLLLARLGLRAKEVTTLALDIDAHVRNPVAHSRGLSHSTAFARTFALASLM